MLWQLLWIFMLMASQWTLINPELGALGRTLKPNAEQQRCIKQMAWHYRLSAISIVAPSVAELDLSEACQYAPSE